MPMFEVAVQAVCVCLVEADDETAATEMAWDEINCGSFSIVDSATKEAHPGAVDSLRRHAELVLTNDD